MLPTQSAYDKFSQLVTYKSFKNRKNKTMFEAFDDAGKAWDVFVYVFAASVGVVKLVRWLNKKLGGRNA